MLLQLLSQLHRQPCLADLLTRYTAVSSFSASTRLSRCTVLQQQALAQAIHSTRSKHSSSADRSSNCMAHEAAAECIHLRHNSIFSLRHLHSKPDGAAATMSAPQDMAVGYRSAKEQAGSSMPDRSNQSTSKSGRAHSTGRSTQHSRSAQQRRQPRVDRWQPLQQSTSGQTRRPAVPRSSGRSWDAVKASKQRQDVIMGADTAEQLLQIVQQHASQLDQFNVTAAFTRAAKVCISQDTVMEYAAVQQLLQLLPELAQRVQQQLRPREFANIMHACGALQLPGVVVRLLPALLHPDMQEQVSAREISNSLHGAAKSKAAISGVQLQQLLAAFTMQLDAANPQDISNFFWAIAHIGQQTSQEQLQPVLQRFVQVLPAAKPQELSNVLWAVASIEQQLTSEQLQPMLEHIMQVLPQAKPQEVSNTLWAVAKMKYIPVQLLTKLAEHPQLVLQMVQPKEVTGSAYALGQMGCSTELLLGDLLKQTTLRSGEVAYDSLACATLCWAAAVLDLQSHTPQLLKLAAVAASTPEAWQSCTEEQLRQFYQVHLWLLDTQCAAGLCGVLTDEQLQQCQARFLQQLEYNGQVSKASAFHRDVLQFLLQLPASTWQKPPVMEQRTSDGNFSIDIAAVRADGVWLAVEVDGPTHFLQPIMLLEGQEPSNPVLNGPTKSRNRAYAARGYVVVSVPYYEWDVLKTQQQKQSYMLAKVRAAC